MRAPFAALGRVGDHSLRLRKRITYGNSFRPWLKGEMVDAAGFTEIRCRFGMHPFVIAFMGLWFGGVLLIGGAIFAMSLLRLITGQDVGEPVSDTTGDVVGMIMPLAMFAFGVALVACGRRLARDEQKFLLALLRDTIDAREV